jgi:hypothetical protein
MVQPLKRHPATLLLPTLAALTRSETFAAKMPETSGALPAVEIPSGGDVQPWQALSEKALAAHDDGNT